MASYLAATEGTLCAAGGGRSRSRGVSFNDFELEEVRHFEVQRPAVWFNDVGLEEVRHFEVQKPAVWFNDVELEEVRHFEVQSDLESDSEDGNDFEDRPALGGAPRSRRPRMHAVSLKHPRHEDKCRKLKEVQTRESSLAER